MNETGIEHKSEIIKYDGSMEGSEFNSLMHMISVISRLKKMQKTFFTKLDKTEIHEIYYRITFPIRNMNPLIVSSPICVCMMKHCLCVRTIQRNVLDTRYAVSAIVYGTQKSCDDYVYHFNKLRRDNIDVYHNILKHRNKKDTAFQLLSISYKEMFAQCTDIPKNRTLYAQYVERIFQNIMKVFHRDIGHKAYQWILGMFKTYNFCNGESLQIDPYFCPTWDMFGTFHGIQEDDIKILRFPEDKDYRYTTGFEARLGADDRGFIKQARDLFFENKKLVKDRKIILQIASPDGLWVQSAVGKYYRYSDIQIGYSAKGKMQTHETVKHTLARELYEEIDMSLSRSELEFAEYVDSWGNITLFKMDISNMDKLPNNPF